MTDRLIYRYSNRISADSGRVILQYFQPGGSKRRLQILQRIEEIDDHGAGETWKKTQALFENRHRDFAGLVERNFNRVKQFYPQAEKWSAKKQLLAGAYFSNEYTFQSAALMNPSIIPASGDRAGSVEFISSLRAVGEGHISSLVFQGGRMDGNGELELNNIPITAELPETVRMYNSSSGEWEIEFADDSTLEERVIFPVTEDESNGIEDARFVRFSADDGSKKYFATYTAYDGHHINIKLLQTGDFRQFRSVRLQGKAVSDKGAALFPRMIDGQYVMTSRNDGESLFIMYSDDIYRWENSEPIYNPAREWELIQTGNCGSPIETDEGWLLLTHGVGPVRRYVISAILLDLQNPGKVIARLPAPLISPQENERNGYVPNVVYTCGAMAAGDHLLVPFAMSDYCSGYARASIREIINNME